MKSFFLRLFFRAVRHDCMGENGAGEPLRQVTMGNRRHTHRRSGRRESEMPRMQTNLSADGCPAVRDVVHRVGDKWSVSVVASLASGAKRFSSLRRSIAGISQRMLTLTLRALERDGVLTRTLHPTIPPRVDYALTDLGRRWSNQWWRWPTGRASTARTSGKPAGATTAWWRGRRAPRPWTPPAPRVSAPPARPTTNPRPEGRGTVQPPGERPPRRVAAPDPLQAAQVSGSGGCGSVPSAPGGCRSRPGSSRRAAPGWRCCTRQVAFLSRGRRRRQSRTRPCTPRSRAACPVRWPGRSGP